MSYRREGDRFILEMNQENFNYLIFALGIATATLYQQEETFMLDGIIQLLYEIRPRS